MRTAAFTIAACLAVGAGVARAEERTIAGKISDSLCGMSHAEMAAKQKSKISDRDCVIACLKIVVLQDDHPDDGKGSRHDAQPRLSVPRREGEGIGLPGRVFLGIAVLNLEPHQPLPVAMVHLSQAVG